MTPHAMSPKDQYDAIAEGLATVAPIKKGMIFGHPGLKLDGKTFACLYQQDMIFKLQGADHAEALGLEGAHLFDPMGGRPMKSWVQVPYAQAETWPRFTEAALRQLSP